MKRQIYIWFATLLKRVKARGSIIPTSDNLDVMFAGPLLFK